MTDYAIVELRELRADRDRRRALAERQHEALVRRIKAGNVAALSAADYELELAVLAEWEEMRD